MAPAQRVSGVTTGSTGVDDSNNGRGGLWSQILRENARSQDASERAPERQLIVLGARGSGKRTLVARLQRRERTDMPRGMALEYTHVECSGFLPTMEPAEPVGQTARLGVWDLNSPTPDDHVDLLSVPLEPVRAPGAAFLIVVDMSRPWDIVSQLEGWLGTVRKAAQAAWKAMDLAAAQAKENGGDRNDDNDNNYDAENNDMDGGDLDEGENAGGLDSADGSRKPSAPGGAPKRREPRTSEELLEANLERFRSHAAALRGGERLPLDSMTLTENTGFPIVVAVAKCDEAEHLEREYEFQDHHFEFVQHSLRSICLRYGASLVYTSAKDDANVPVLFDHLNGVLYGWRHDHPAQVIERSSVFVPLGWDSSARLDVLADSLASSRVDAGAAFEDVIPVPKSVQRLAEARGAQTAPVVVENEQAFLRAQLESGAAQSGARDGRSYAAGSAGGSSSIAGSAGATGDSSQPMSSSIGGSAAGDAGSTSASGSSGAASETSGSGASGGKGATGRSGGGSSGAGGGGGDAGTSLNAASEFFATLLPGKGKGTPNRSALRKDVKKEIANLLDGSGK